MIWKSEHEWTKEKLHFRDSETYFKMAKFDGCEEKRLKLLRRAKSKWGIKHDRMKCGSTER